jgi:hypothetical protein
MPERLPDLMAGDTYHHFVPGDLPQHLQCPRLTPVRDVGEGVFAVCRILGRVQRHLGEAVGPPVPFEITLLPQVYDDRSGYSTLPPP